MLDDFSISCFKDVGLQEPIEERPDAESYTYSEEGGDVEYLGLI